MGPTLTPPEGRWRGPGLAGVPPQPGGQPLPGPPSLSCSPAAEQPLPSRRCSGTRSFCPEFRALLVSDGRKPFPGPVASPTCRRPGKVGGLWALGCRLKVAAGTAPHRADDRRTAASGSTEVRRPVGRWLPRSFQILLHHACPGAWRCIVASGGVGVDSSRCDRSRVLNSGLSPRPAWRILDGWPRGSAFMSRAWGSRFC